MHDDQESKAHSRTAISQRVVWNRHINALGTALAAAMAAHAPAQEASSRLDGVWSSTLTTRSHAGWRIEDHLCNACTPGEYRHLQRLLADPANDARPLRELEQEAGAAGRQQLEQNVTAAGRERLARIDQPPDSSEVCDPPNLLLTAAAPLPVSIDVREGDVVIRSQHWNVTRVIPLSDKPPPVFGAPSRYGNATARVEGGTLVVESMNVLPMVLGEAVTTDQATVIERYTATEDGSRLDLTVEIRDPDTFVEPRLLYRPRIRTPDVRLVDDMPCANLED